jgi:hypothetical protein
VPDNLLSLKSRVSGSVNTTDQRLEAVKSAVENANLQGGLGTLQGTLVGHGGRRPVTGFVRLLNSSHGSQDLLLQSRGGWGMFWTSNRNRETAQALLTLAQREGISDAGLQAYLEGKIRSGDKINAQTLSGHLELALKAANEAGNQQLVNPPPEGGQQSDGVRPSSQQLPLQGQPDLIQDFNQDPVPEQQLGEQPPLPLQQPQPNSELPDPLIDRPLSNQLPSEQQNPSVPADNDDQLTEPEQLNPSRLSLDSNRFVPYNDEIDPEGDLEQQWDFGRQNDEHRDSIFTDSGKLPRIVSYRPDDDSGLDPDPNLIPDPNPIPNPKPLPIPIPDTIDESYSQDDEIELKPQSDEIAQRKLHAAARRREFLHAAEKGPPDLSREFSALQEERNALETNLEEFRQEWLKHVETASGALQFQRDAVAAEGFSKSAENLNAAILDLQGELLQASETLAKLQKEGEEVLAAEKLAPNPAEDQRVKKLLNFYDDWTTYFNKSLDAQDQNTELLESLSGELRDLSDRTISEFNRVNSDRNSELQKLLTPLQRQLTWIETRVTELKEGQEDAIRRRNIDELSWANKSMESRHIELEGSPGGEPPGLVKELTEFRDKANQRLNEFKNMGLTDDPLADYAQPFNALYDWAVQAIEQGEALQKQAIARELPASNPIGTADTSRSVASDNATSESAEREAVSAQLSNSRKEMREKALRVVNETLINLQTEARDFANFKSLATKMTNGVQLKELRGMYETLIAEHASSGARSIEPEGERKRLIETIRFIRDTFHDLDSWQTDSIAQSVLTQHQNEQMLRQLDLARQQSELASMQAERNVRLEDAKGNYLALKRASELAGALEEEAYAAIDAEEKPSAEELALESQIAETSTFVNDLTAGIRANLQAREAAATWRDRVDDLTRDHIESVGEMKFGE